MTILCSEFLLNSLSQFQGSLVVTLMLYLMNTVWFSTIQVTWIRLKSNVATGPACCPVTNTKFLQKGVFIYFI